jgi:hypothetical protein
MSRPVELAVTVGHVPLGGHTVTLGGEGQVMSLCLDSYSSSHCANTGWFLTCETLGSLTFPHLTSHQEQKCGMTQWIGIDF